MNLFLTFTILMSVFSWYTWSCRSILSVSQAHTAFVELLYHCCSKQGGKPVKLRLQVCSSNTSYRVI